MSIAAFAGPSLTARDRSTFPAIRWMPPAEAGDLLRLSPGDHETICLIDGYFDHRPAVRHKEILLLLSRGVRIIGASSIGALRAAEMASFGMVGVGAIYRGYANGRINGDDEVALVHGPAERDWRPMSVPLVDARATLCRAVRTRVLSPVEARALWVAARAIHYADRSWSALLAGDALPASARAGFAAWLKEGAVGQKRLDALACLTAATARPRDRRPSPGFVRTVFVDSLARDRGVVLDPWLQAPAPAKPRSSRGDRPAETDSGAGPTA